MNKPTNNTLKYVVIGGVALYALSKLDIAGKVGSAVGGAAGSALAGAGAAAGGAVTELLQGAASGGWGIFTGLGKGVVTTVASPFTGGIEGAEKIYNEGSNDIKQYGVVKAVFAASPIGILTHQPEKLISPNMSYNKSLGRMSYIADTEDTNNRYQAVAAITSQGYAPGDAAYLLALQQGRDVSNWNTDSLTPEFKQAMGIGGVN